MASRRHASGRRLQTRVRHLWAGAVLLLAPATPIFSYMAYLYSIYHHSISKHSMHHIWRISYHTSRDHIYIYIYIYRIRSCHVISKSQHHMISRDIMSSHITLYNRISIHIVSYYLSHHHIIPSHIILSCAIMS